MDALYDLEPMRRFARIELAEDTSMQRSSRRPAFAQAQ
jgi:hypothetical protein